MNLRSPAGRHLTAAVVVDTIFGFDLSGPRAHHQHAIHIPRPPLQVVGDQHHRFSTPQNGERTIDYQPWLVRAKLSMRIKLGLVTIAVRALPHSADNLRIMMPKSSEAELGQHVLTLSGPARGTPERSVGPTFRKTERHGSSASVEHIADAAAILLGSPIEDTDGAARRLDQSGQDIEQRALAATTRSNQRDEFTRPHL